MKRYSTYTVFWLLLADAGTTTAVQIGTWLPRTRIHDAEAAKAPDSEQVTYVDDVSVEGQQTSVVGPDGTSIFVPDSTKGMKVSGTLQSRLGSLTKTAKLGAWSFVYDD